MIVTEQTRRKVLDTYPTKEEQVRAFMQAHLRRAGRARTNVQHFFPFVIREETTRERIKLMPFQSVVYQFVDHYHRCVIRKPVGFSKTYLMSALSMFLLGKNNTTRGAIISASQDQAKKPVGMVRDAIDTNADLRLVFPDLQPSPREADPWTQAKITVARPAGIRDPSLSAVGYRGKLPGSRLNWILVDDILTEENTSTAEGRDGVRKWFNSTVLSRRDIKGSKVVVTNTPWHPDDLTYRLEEAGWPTITVDINGNIYFKNADDFDSDDIRPSEIDEQSHRLVAHDSPVYDPSLQHLEPAERLKAKKTWFDTHDVVPLWPEKYGVAEIEQLKHDFRNSMHEYYQLYECKCRDDEEARVKTAWIEQCKAAAREKSIFTFTSKWTEGGAFTGIDLAVGLKKKNDRTSIFTFAVLDDGSKRLLRLDSGRWKGRTIIDMLCEHHEAYNSIIRVENNAAQDYIRQWALDRNKLLPVRGMPTGKNKHHKRHGVESIFIEIENGTWLIPNLPDGSVVESVQRWIDSMLYYDPDTHTGDELMSCWLAREQARDSGFLRRDRKKKPGPPIGGIIGAR